MDQLVIVDDVLAGSEPVTEAEAAQDDLLQDYRAHWTGHRDSPFPLTQRQWRAALGGSVGVVDMTTAAAAEAGLDSKGQQRTLSGGSDHLRQEANRAFHEGIDLRMLDLGATYGLRLHDPGSLRVAHGLLNLAFSLVHPIAAFLPQWVPLLPAMASYLSTAVGAVARERLLVEGRIQYALIGASKDATPFSQEELADLRR